MNKILLSLIFLPFILNAQPSWFYNIKPKNNEIIGYGLAENLFEAKKYAIDEISKTLSLNINSNYNLKKTYENNSLIKKDISSSININSNNQLKNVGFTKIIKIDNIWYVAATYDNSTIVQKIKRKLQTQLLKNESQNKYLEKTPLIKSINKALGFKIDFDLIYKNKTWYLSYENNLFDLNQNDFYQLFYDYENNLKIDTNKLVYDDNERIVFDLKVPNKIYITLFNVQFDGNVGILKENLLIDEHILINEFITANPYSNQIQEQFIVIQSNKPINIKDYTKIDNKLLDNNEFMFTKLLKLLNEKDFSTKTIKINKGY